jgi:tRNA uridine 5-carbamoylmethylation protein Kti12
MPKKRANGGLDYVHEDDAQPNQSEAPRKKKKAGDEESRIVTASGLKLDLKKSKKIKELRRQREEKLTKNRKRKLKQITERKVKRQTVSIQKGFQTCYFV